jgi:methylmalonyl-CoA/ethylmalonyl-CoA epimerase
MSRTSENNRFTAISQIGIVIRDKERLLLHMQKVFAAEPSRVVRTTLDDGRIYRGRPGNFSAELIFYSFASIELEFILPLEGESIWQDYLNEHGESIHHIQFSVDSFEGARADLQDAGMEMIQEGNSASLVPGLKWGYFDSTEMLPFILEIVNSSEVARKSLNTDTL